MKKKLTTEEKFNKWIPVAINLCDPYKDSHHYEDLKQEALLVLWRRFFVQKGLLYVNSLKEVIETACSKFIETNSDNHSLESLAESPTEVIAKKEKISTAVKFISKLSERDQQVMFYYLKGSSNAETCKEIGITWGTVRKVRNETIKALGFAVAETEKPNYSQIEWEHKQRANQRHEEYKKSIKRQLDELIAKEKAAQIAIDQSETPTDKQRQETAENRSKSNQLMKKYKVIKEEGWEERRQERIEREWQERMEREWQEKLERKRLTKEKKQAQRDNLI